MINEWLSKPFPYIQSLKQQLLIPFGSGLIVLFFLLLFQPFGIDILLAGAFWHLAMFGLIAFFVISANLIVLPIIIPRIVNPETWNIGKNLLFILWILLVISFCNYGYAQYLAGTVYTQVLEESGKSGLLSWIFMTCTVGIFPVLLIVYFSERQLLLRNRRYAKEISEERSHQKGLQNSVGVSLETGKANSININSSEIICARADGGNYQTVFWQHDSETRSELVRLTLLDFLTKVEKTNSFIRCHKSYIVNLDKIEKVKGNARSLMLVLDGLEFQVPVSRSFPREKLVKART